MKINIRKYSSKPIKDENPENQTLLNPMSDLRSGFSSFKINVGNLDRPLLIHEKSPELFSFTGTRVNHTLSLLLTMAGIRNSVNEKDCTCVIHIDTSKENFMEGWGLLLNQLPEVDSHIATLLETNPAILGFSKWGKYLPIEFQIDLLKQKYFVGNPLKLTPVTRGS